MFVYFLFNFGCRNFVIVTYYVHGVQTRGEICVVLSKTETVAPPHDNFSCTFGTGNN